MTGLTPTEGKREEGIHAVSGASPLKWEKKKKMMIIVLPGGGGLSKAD